MAQWFLRIFFYSFLAGPSVQLLHNSAMEFPMYDGSANSGSFRR
jgi:hypothetical protein